MGSMERKNGNDGAADGLAGPANDELTLLKNQLAAIGKSQAIAEYGIDGRVLTANDNFLSAFGYTLGEVQGQHHSMFVGTEERAGMDYRYFWDKLSRGEAQAGQYERVGRDGKVLWLQASYCPVAGDDGKPVKVFEIATEITDAKLKQIEVETELKVRSDIMNTTSIVSYADTRGDILDVNEKYIEISKYSRDELIGRGHNITRHPDMPKEVFKEMWSTIGRGRIFRGVVKNRAKDGTPYYVDAVIAPILGKNGKPSRYLGVRYDITATEIERQNMKGVLDAIDASFAYVEFDTSGNILNANNNFLQVVGYRLDEVVGRHHRMFVDSAYSATSAYADFWAELKNGKSFVDVCKRIAKSGEEVWIQAVYSSVKDEMGRVVKVVKIALDVTKEKRAAQALQEAVEQTQAVVGAAQEGDLTQRISMEGKSGSVADLCEGVNSLVENMATVVGQVKDASEVISTASCSACAARFSFVTSSAIFTTLTTRPISSFTDEYTAWIQTSSPDFAIRLH
ncbi:MAG: PAS domain S-box protein, partial [Thermomicrobiales bacterium]